MTEFRPGDRARYFLDAANTTGALVVESRPWVPSVVLWHNDGSQAEYSPVDLIRVSRPIYPAKGQVAVLLDKDMSKLRVIVTVRGGCVENVYTDHAGETDVTLLDFDSYEGGDEETVAALDEGRKEVIQGVKVGELREVY